jgi:serine/threonine-protein kinase
MGEVYRARDTKLGRDVAVKVLPASFAHDATRVTRLQREARLLATLNHPNVAAIHGLEDSDGVVGIVLELVEGQTLAERLTAGAIPMAEALAFARQVIDGLEAAHEKGIVHRDLKPANLKVRADGVVKILDFGVAKAVADNTSAEDAPTLTLNLTRESAIVGTAAYMSPEQARGLAVDKRTDIWAFGCVLYELLTGRRPFTGATITDVLAAIVEHEPDWTALPPSTPASIKRLLRRCLEKDPKRRLRDIGDARIDIDSQEQEASVPYSRSPRIPRRNWILAAAALLMAGAGLGWAAGSLVRRDSTTPSMMLTMETLPDNRTFPPGGFETGSMLALAPGGNRLVYVARQGGEQRLFIRSLDRLDQLSSTVIGETRAREPFFSPDGEWLGYRAGLSLRRVSVRGGLAETIAELPSGTGPSIGISWSSDGSILIGAGRNGLLRVSERGGPIETLVTPTKDRAIWYPQALPGGRTVLYTQGETTPGSGELLLLDVVTRTSKRLRAGTAGRYLPTGHLVFVVDGTLWATAFDIERAEARGTTVPVIKGVRVDSEAGVVQASMTESGALAYLPATSSLERTLVWADPRKETPVGVPSRAYANPRVSPDGTRIAVTVRDGGQDIFVWDVSRNMLRQLTFDPAANATVTWLDNDRLAFSAEVDGWAQVFVQAADGLSAAKQLTSTLPTFPFSASRDGNLLFVREYPSDTGWDIGLLPVRDPATRRTVERTKWLEHNPGLSPDGRWLTYQSNKTGRFEIFVRSFPLSGAGEIQITSQGGTRPVWSRDGKTLFFWNESDDSTSLYGIKVNAGPPATWGAPTVAIKGSYVSAGNDTSYDVFGERFLLMKNVVPDGTMPRHEIVIAQNWFAELARLAPR